MEVYFRIIIILFFYHVYETLLDAVECRPQSTANQPQSGWFILQQRDKNTTTHSQRDGP